MRRGLVGEEGGSWLGPWPVSIEAIDDILGIELSCLLRTCAAFIVVDEQCSKSQPKSGAMSTDKIQGAFTVAREISLIFLLSKLRGQAQAFNHPDIGGTAWQSLIAQFLQDIQMPASA
jgi:hypothetical protein